MIRSTVDAVGKKPLSGFRSLSAPELQGNLAVTFTFEKYWGIRLLQFRRWIMS